MRGWWGFWVELGEGIGRMGERETGIMKHKHREHVRMLLMCLEVVMLAIMTPAVLPRVYRLIGPIETHVLGSATPKLFICLILLADAFWIVAVIKWPFVKNKYVRVATTWLVLTVSASLITCVLAPYIISGVSL